MPSDTSATVTDRVVVITGAGQGIGRAYAHHFADNGAIPVIADIDGENGLKVAAEIESGGGRALAVQTDVTSPESVEAMVDATRSAFGRLDVLINNAAIFVTLGRRPFEAENLHCGVVIVEQRALCGLTHQFLVDRIV